MLNVKKIVTGQKENDNYGWLQQLVFLKRLSHWGLCLQICIDMDQKASRNQWDQSWGRGSCKVNQTQYISTSKCPQIWMKYNNKRNVCKLLYNDMQDKVMQTT